MSAEQLGKRRRREAPWRLSKLRVYGVYRHTGEQHCTLSVLLNIYANGMQDNVTISRA
jgi:hypothetical protein